ncbi:LOW QUALITY PROTEIN: Hypothetical protein PHPALM_16764, partial [Phytophthora palmivora]
TAEIRLRGQTSNPYKLWVTRGDRWVPTITVGPGRTRYLQVTSISDHALTLHEGSRVAMWLSGDRVPRIPGYVSVGSRRYAEWQISRIRRLRMRLVKWILTSRSPSKRWNISLTPTAILPRPAKAIQNIEVAGDGDVSLPLSKCTSDQGKIDPVKSNDLHTKI